MPVSSSLLIRRAHVLHPDGTLAVADVSVQAGKILQVAPELSVEPGYEVIDATGLTLLLGAIDPQVHF